MLVNAVVVRGGHNSGHGCRGNYGRSMITRVRIKAGVTALGYSKNCEEEGVQKYITHRELCAQTRVRQELFRARGERR